MELNNTILVADWVKRKAEASEAEAPIQARLLFSAPEPTCFQSSQPKDGECDSRISDACPSQQFCKIPLSSLLSLTRNIAAKQCLARSYVRSFALLQLNGVLFCRRTFNDHYDANKTKAEAKVGHRRRSHHFKSQLSVCPSLALRVKACFQTLQGILPHSLAIPGTGPHVGLPECRPETCVSHGGNSRSLRNASSRRLNAHSQSLAEKLEDGSCYRQARNIEHDSNINLQAGK